MAPEPRTSFLQTLTHFDASQLAPWMGLRNAIGVAIALSAGVALHSSGGGLVAATGALDAAFSDGSDPYLLRARRMLAATAFVALAVFAGRWCGANHALAVTLEAACAFAAGMVVATGETAGNIGSITLVTLIIFSAQPAPAGKAFTSGLLILAGGALQTLLSVALWPVRRYYPEAMALGTLYAELARIAESEARALEAPPATAPILAARKAMAGLGQIHSVESERYLALFSQAERIRLALLTLVRLRTRLGRLPDGGHDADLLGRCLQLTARMLSSIAIFVECRSKRRSAPRVPGGVARTGRKPARVAPLRGRGRDAVRRPLAGGRAGRPVAHLHGNGGTRDAGGAGGVSPQRVQATLAAANWVEPWRCSART